MKISGVKLSVRIIFSIIFASLAAEAWSQISEDTIRINEVVIKRNRSLQGIPGFKQISVDSTLLKYNSLGPVSETIESCTQMFFKSYGAGASSTTSFRGSGSARTEVTWNGVTINDPMLGDADFSLFPGGMAEGIQVSYGAASMIKGFGGIGGLIDFVNKPDWSRKTSADISSGVGSFGTTSALVRIRTGSENFQSVTKFFSTSSRNDYPFLNEDASPVPEVQKRKNGNGSRAGFMQEFYLRSHMFTTSARIWYQGASRHLPGSTLYEVPDSAEYQKDESLRTQVSSEYSNGANNVFVNATWLYSKLNYFFPKYFIDSRNHSNSIVLKAGYSRKLANNNSVNIVLDNEISGVRSVNYSSYQSRSTTSLAVSAEHKLTGRFGGIILAREIIFDHKFLFPDFSAGAQYRIFKGSDHFLKANISRNSSFPTMNDLFWNPGGNPALKNEHTYSLEFGYSLDQDLSNNIRLNAEVTLFRNFIRDMIQWHPGDSFYWVADNIGSVNASGLESSMNLKYVHKRFSLNINAGYVFTRAIEVNEPSDAGNGKQLVYVPGNKASGNLQISYGKLHFTWMANYTGMVWTTSDNSGYLKGYALNGFKAGYLFTPGRTGIDINFGSDNIFDISHQAIAHYPLPGRSYNLSIIFSFQAKY